MVRRSLFQRLRQRGAALGAVLIYAILLNAVIAAAFNVQAVTAALDPLAAAVNCDPVGSDPAGGNPAQHKNRHQPDCTLCGPACPMAGAAQALGGTVALFAPPFLSYDRPEAVRATSHVHPPSLYRSDTDAQAPPAFG